MGENLSDCFKCAAGNPDDPCEKSHGEWQDLERLADGTPRFSPVGDRVLLESVVDRTDRIRFNIAYSGSDGH